MARSLNVAFLTSARAWRGSGVSLTHIAKGLSSRGHRVCILAGEDRVVQEFRDRGLQATRIRTANTGPRGALALVRSLRVMRAECLMVDRPRDLRLGALASIAHPLPLINRYNLSRRTPPRDLLSRLAYLVVRLTIFVSETNARQALTHAAYLRHRPHRVIPEGVAPEFYPDPVAAGEFRAMHGIGDQEFVLAVGSLTADKRYEFLFDALSRLGPAAPLLVVCGAGPQSEYLKQRADALRLKVTFPGLVPSGLLRGAYTAATLMVHACQIETFGLSVLEAMACGCAVLAVDGGAIPEVLGQAGVLTDPRDSRAFSASLVELLSDPGRRQELGSAARLRAQRFSLHQMQDAYCEAIEWVCSPAEAKGSARDGEAAAPYS
jgi:glycosyltransferase involved in cell wall biosynthesis